MLYVRTHKNDVKHFLNRLIIHLSCTFAAAIVSLKSFLSQFGNSSILFKFQILINALSSPDLPFFLSLSLSFESIDANSIY